MERLSYLAHDIYQTDATICNILWKLVEGEPCLLHAQTEQGI